MARLSAVEELVQDQVIDIAAILLHRAALTAICPVRRPDNHTGAAAKDRART